MIKSINKQLECEMGNIEGIIEELTERNEYACTLNGSAGTACGIN